MRPLSPAARQALRRAQRPNPEPGRPTIEVAIELLAEEASVEEADVASFLAEWVAVGSAADAPAEPAPEAPSGPGGRHARSQPAPSAPREAAPIPVEADGGRFSWNLATNELELSAEWLAMLGLWEGEVGASPDEWFSRIHPDDLPGVLGAVSARLGGNDTPLAIGYRIRHADGAFRRVDATAVTLRDASGTPYRVTGAQREVADTSAPRRAPDAE
jgi:PAS domain-containing protein